MSNVDARPASVLARYSKATAAGVAGAVATLVLVVTGVDISAPAAAVAQLVAVVAAVFFAPKNAD